MIITRNTGLDFNVFAELHDLDALALRGYCMVRDGLIGRDSKTFLQYEDRNETYADLDGYADLVIGFPETTLNHDFTVPRENITAVGHDTVGRLNHFFGETGKVVVKFAVIKHDWFA